MHLELLELSGIILLSVAAQWIAWRLKIPSILMLLSFGLLAGPVLGAVSFGGHTWRLVHPDELFGPSLQAIVSASVAIILFEGGLTLRFSELERYGRLVLRMLTIGALVTWIGCTLGGHYLVDLPWSLAALFGANLVVTGPTVIGPMLRHIRPNQRVSALLKWESIVVDPVGASLTVLTFEAFFGSTAFFSEPTARLGSAIALTILAGFVLGSLGAVAIVLALKNYLVPDSLHSSFALSMVLVVHAVANLVQEESGLLAVTILGVLLANQKQVVIKHIVEFKEILRDLLIGALFVLLAARLELDDLAQAWLPALAFLAFAVVVVRPVSIFAATIRSGLEWREKAFLSWMAPRGVVAAAVASAIALKLQSLADESGLSPEVAERVGRIVPATFVVIIGTVTLYGLTAGYLARWLGLTARTSHGALILGAHPWGRDLAKALQDAGCPVLLVDSNRSAVNAARLSGLRTYLGSALSEHAIERIDLSEMGRMLALTKNDEINSLACLRYVEFFGREETYQLPFAMGKSEGRNEKVPSTQRGRFLFSPNMTFSRIEELYEKGAVFKTTKLSAEFSFDDWTEKYSERAVPLFLIKKTGGLLVYTIDASRKPSAGDSLLCLLSPEDPEIRETAPPEAPDEKIVTEDDAKSVGSE